jgi:protoporphyrinogen/coproporphyrinogen III oxidase
VSSAPAEPPRYVVVVGAGITGLSAAWALARQGTIVTVLEASDRPGGVIASEWQNGFLIERGPGSLRETDTVAEMVTSLCLGTQRIAPSPAARRRYVLRNAALVRVPMSPLEFIRTPLLSIGGKVRLLAEPLAPRSSSPDESVAAFARRRLGPEALAYLVNPLVAGIHAGDPARLSARYALPALVTVEEQYGSLLAGALRGRRSRPATFISFRDGLSALPHALARSLGTRVIRRTRVTAIRPDAGRWWVQSAGPGGARVDEADAVVVAVPARALTSIGLPPALQEHLRPVRRVVAPSVVTIALGYRRDHVRHPLDGFGFLVPAAERSHLLGATFSSALFEGRAPPGYVLLTCFVGGTRAPGLATRPDSVLLKLIAADLRRFLGVTGAPVMTAITRWNHAIPQYDVGYAKVMAAIKATESAAPGLYLAGSYRGGTSLGDCITCGCQTAARLLSPPAASALIGPHTHALPAPAG